MTLCFKKETFLNQKIIRHQTDEMIMIGIDMIGVVEVEVTDIVDLREDLPGKLEITEVVEEEEVDIEIEI